MQTDEPDRPSREARGPVRRRPALGLALALMVGIVAAWRLGLTPAWLIGAGGITVGLGMVLLVRRPSSRGAALVGLAAVVVVGAARYWLATTPLDPAHLGRFATDQRALVRLTGHLITEPHERDPHASGSPFGRVIGPSTSFYVRATSIRHGEVRRPGRGRVLVVVHDHVVGFRAGDGVEIVGRLTRPTGPTNPGQRVQPGARVAAILVTDHAEGIAHLPVGRLPFRTGVLAGLRRHMASSLDRHLDRRTAGALKALLIGDRRRIDSDLRHAFVVTGTAHLLAISGLHVGLVAGMAWLILRALRVPERPTLAAVMAVAFLYAMVTGLHAPALRACVMIAVLALGGLVRRSPDRLNSLGLAAVVVLMVDPTDLFEAGFHLSFVATLGLVLFVEPVSRALRHVERRLFLSVLERRHLARVAQPGSQHRAGGKAVRFVRRSVVVCFVAWIVTAPLSAHYFRYVAWVCPLATLAAAPLLWATISTAFLLCLVDVVGAGSVVAPLVELSFHLLEGTVTAFADIPSSAALDKWSPTMGVVLLCYVALGTVAMRVHRGLSNRRLVVALVLVAAGVAWRSGASTAPAVPELTVLDVGHGQCAVLRTPEGRAVLFDAGSLTRAGGASRTAIRALAALNVNRIDLIVLSHPDLDHYSAVPGVLAAFRVDAVVVPRRFTVSEDPDAQRLIDCVVAARVPIRVVEAGAVIDWLPPLVLRVLHPPLDSEGLSDNDGSLVIRAEYGAVSLLSTGDLQEAGMDALGAHREALASEVLIAPHHGGREPNLADLVQSARPRVVVISGPVTRGVGLSEPVYRGAGASVFVTGRDGAVTVRLLPEPVVYTWR